MMQFVFVYTIRKRKWKKLDFPTAVKQMRERAYGYTRAVFVVDWALEKSPSNPSMEVQPKLAIEPPPKKARTGGLANMMDMLRVEGDYVMQLYYEVMSFINEITYSRQFIAR
jgi:hypothetical protein